MTWFDIITYGWSCTCAGCVIGWFIGYYIAPIGSRRRKVKHHG